MEIDGPESMPLCPGCGSPIEAHEDAEVIMAFGYQGLACQVCIDELEQSDD